MSSIHQGRQRVHGLKSSASSTIRDDDYIPGRVAQLIHTTHLANLVRPKIIQVYLDVVE